MLFAAQDSKVRAPKDHGKMFRSKLATSFNTIVHSYVSLIFYPCGCEYGILFQQQCATGQLFDNLIMKYLVFKSFCDPPYTLSDNKLTNLNSFWI